MSKKKRVLEFDLDESGIAEMLKTEPSQVLDWKPENEIYTEDQKLQIKNCFPKSLDKESYDIWLSVIMNEARQYQNGYKNDVIGKYEFEDFRKALKKLDGISAFLVEEIFKFPYLIDAYFSGTQKQALEGLFIASRQVNKMRLYDLKLKDGRTPQDLQKFIVALADIFKNMGGKPSASGKETKKGYSVSPFIRFVYVCAKPINVPKQYKDKEKMAEYVKSVLKGMG